ncbi:hypothetical protein F2981_26830 (plasmid) [Sinorhizobium meliloti]|nr:hypothetical protein [Sinorhizobium meliloti]
MGLTPIGALAAGIETVYQDLSLLPNLSVEENVALTQQLVAPTAASRGVSTSRVCGRRPSCIEDVGLPTEPAFWRHPSKNSPSQAAPAHCHCRAIASDAGLVIMDEPTTALDAARSGQPHPRRARPARQGRVCPFRHAQASTNAGDRRAGDHQCGTA